MSSLRFLLAVLVLGWGSPAAWASAEDDADCDGLLDSDEDALGTDLFDDDTDDDGLLDGEEVELGTDPLLEDTDFGGVNDGDEVLNGTDPLDSTDDDNEPEPILWRGRGGCDSTAGPSGWFGLAALLLIRRRR